MKTKGLLFFLLALVPLFIWVIGQSDRFEGGEDGVMHYLFAKYAIQHPENLIDHWAKPVFTLVALPFAQIDFKAVMMLNVLLGLMAAWLSAQICTLLGFRFPWLAAILLVMSPQYFYAMPSGITEVIFSSMLVATLYLLLKKQLAWALVLASFLPFARSEGYITWLFFVLYYLTVKQWRYLPLLATGTLLYGLLGWYLKGDFLWFINDYPYHDASDIYGKGQWGHYTGQGHYIWGRAAWYLLLIGFIFFSADGIRALLGRPGHYPLPTVHWPINAKQHSAYWLWLVLGIFSAYLFGHSYVWQAGKSASFGLTRVMVATLPLAAIAAVGGLNRLLYLFNPNLKLIPLMALLVVLWLTVTNFAQQLRLPFTGDREKAMMAEVGQWYRQQPDYGQQRKVCYFAPSAALAFGVNPFSPNERGWLHAGLHHEQLSTGTLIVWDSHFGPNEGRLPLDTLLTRPDLKLRAAFIPPDSFITLNYQLFQIRVYEVVAAP